MLLRMLADEAYGNLDLVPGYWDDFHLEQFTWVLYMLFLLIVLYLSIKIYSKIVQEEQEELQYFWMIFYISIPMFLTTVIAFLNLTSYAFNYVPTSGLGFEIIVTDIFDDGLKSILYYSLSVFGVLLLNFGFYRLIFRHYYQMPQTITYISLLCAVTTAPWVFFFIH